MDESVELLLVEDNPADAKLLREIIREKGFKGTLNWVVDGAKALDFIFQREQYSQAHTPDAILLDLNLPKVDGREVLKQVRKHPKHNSIPIVIVTTSTRSQDILNSQEFLASAYLVKPSGLKEFEAMVDRLLQVELPRLGVGKRS